MAGKPKKKRPTGAGKRVPAGRTAASRHARDVLRELESRFRSTFEQAAVGLAHTTLEGAFLQVNGRLCRMLGYTASELRSLTTRGLTHPDDRDRQDILRRELIAGRRRSFAAEKRYVCKSGAVIWVNRTVTLARSPLTGERYLIQVIEDITERKHTEARLARQTRARLVMAECNQVLVHADDEAKMLEHMCRIVVESGGYRMAWVGYADDAGPSLVRVMAHAGYGTDAPLAATGGREADGSYRGFVYETIATGRINVARDILNDPRHARRKARALQRGFQSSIALPLKVDGTMLGVIAIYASEADAFDEEEIVLLTDLAEDISYGIGHLRVRLAHRQAETRLRESERRVREVFDHAAVGIARTDPGGITVEVNRRFCEMLGYKREELIGRHVREITHPDDYGQGAQYRNDARLGADTDTFSGEKRFLRKDGSVLWARRTASVMRDATGKVIDLVAVIEDITERKALEHQFRDTFEQAAMGIIHAGLDGRYLRVNRKLCDITGYTEAELTAPRAPRLSHPDDIDSGEADRRRLLSGEIASHSNEKRYVRKDGTVIWVNRTESVARNALGEPMYFIRVIEDITQRKELERQFRDNFDQAAVGIAHVGFDNNYIRVNRKLCEITGYSEQELIGRSAATPSHPEDAGSGNEQRRRLFAGEIASFNNEKRYIHKDGHQIWVRRTESLARDADGKPVYCIRVIEDITEQKAADERYRATVENAPVGILHTAYGGDEILQVNPKLCEMLGYTHDQLCRMKTDDIVHPEHLRRDRPTYRDRMLKGELGSFSSEIRYVRKDGSVLWAHRTVSLVRDASGMPQYFIRVIQDITDRKRAEEAVARERALLRTVVDNLPDRIYAKDLEGRFLLQNALNARAHGAASPEELLGKTVFDVFPREVAERVEREDRAIIASGQPLVDRERATVHKDGQTRWVTSTKVPLRDADGKIFGLIGVNRDITERKRMEQELRENVKRFEVAARVTNDVIWDWDLKANSIWWSDGFQSLFGYDRQAIEPGPESWYSRLHPTEHDRVVTGIRRVIELGEAYWSDEYRFRRADGSYARIYDRGYLIQGDDGTPLRMIGAMVDVTERTLSARRRNLEHAVAGVLAGSPNLEAAMPRLIRAMCEAMDWAYGAHWICDPRSVDMRRADFWADAPIEFDPADRDLWLRQSGPDGSRTLLRRAWSRQEPTWIDDLERRNFRRGASARKLGFRSAFAFPIVAGGGVIGLLEFFGREARQMDEVLLDTARSIGGQIGQFIQRKNAEQALLESEEQFRQLSGNIPQVFWITDVEQKRTLYISPAAEIMLGRPLQQLIEHPRLLIQAIHPEDRPRVHQARKKAVEGGYDETYRIIRADGSIRWVNDRAFPVRDAAGRAHRIAGIAEDVTDRIHAEERLKQLAHYDVLTGLPNRSLYYDRLRQALAQAKRNGWTAGVMFVDMDRFKIVNDTLGHSVGDQLLQQAAERLRQSVRANDTVGRLGGDEFAIVLASLTEAKDAGLVAQKIIASFNEPFRLEGSEIYVTVSIGITLYPHDGIEQETLIKNADTAMYRAKEAGRNSYQFYRPEMNAKAREFLSLESSLRRALEQNQFVLHYQPKAHVATGEIAGMEALLRWRHPARGLVPPLDFIPILEETGLIVAVGEWVISTVCAQLDVWRRGGLKVVPVAINLSPRQFVARDLGARIRRLLEQGRTDPRLIEFELTEGSLISNVEESRRTLTYLKSLGVGLSIDDFGTGYSSLAYLKRFPLDALKIDRSFIRDVTTNVDDATITRTVISMAHSLGLKVVAEGVETVEQLMFLAGDGCDQVQGYYFAPPLPEAECAVWLAEDRRLKRALG